MPYRTIRGRVSTRASQKTLAVGSEQDLRGGWCSGGEQVGLVDGRCAGREVPLLLAISRTLPLEVDLKRTPVASLRLQRDARVNTVNPF